MIFFNLNSHNFDVKMFHVKHFCLCTNYLAITLFNINYLAIIPIDTTYLEIILFGTNYLEIISWSNLLYIDKVYNGVSWSYITTYSIYVNLYTQYTLFTFDTQIHYLYKTVCITNYIYTFMQISKYLNIKKKIILVDISIQLCLLYWNINSVMFTKHNVILYKLFHVKQFEKQVCILWK